MGAGRAAVPGDRFTATTARDDGPRTARDGRGAGPRPGADPGTGPYPEPDIVPGTEAFAVDGLVGRGCSARGPLVKARPRLRQFAGAGTTASRGVAVGTYRSVLAPLLEVAGTRSLWIALATPWIVLTP